MVNYNNGKIYKIEPIIDHDEGEIYVGSTTKHYLSQRMDTHRCSYKRFKQEKTKQKLTSFILFEKYGITNCEIILIESVNVNTNDELKAREKYYIQLFKCVNKNIPNRTHKEYYETNKNKIKEYREDNKEKIKEYRNDNKEKIKEQKKDYYENNKEKIKEYYEINVEKIKNQMKEYYEKNKEKTIEYNKKKYICCCGTVCSYRDKSTHFKTIKHVKYIIEIIT